jgi:anti-anti-sigma regulatory factor
MSKKPLRLVPRDGFTVLELGTMEIWDGADMALLRESLTRLIKAEKHLAIAIDMTYVKYIPSGFFGMLFDWFETGVRIRLYSPQPNVRKMLWFNQFFESVGLDGFDLAPRPAVAFEPDYTMNGASPSHNSRVEPKKVVARAGR